MAGSLDQDNHSSESTSASTGALKRWLPLLILVTIFFALFGVDRFVFEFSQYLNFESLRENREAITSWVAMNYVMAAVLYTVIYILVAAFSLPFATILSVTGGFVFGWLFGGVFTLLGATIGATLVFLAARSALGDFLRKRAGPTIKKMEAGFQENAWSYMLILRLLPIFPFFLVNLVPAFLGVSLAVFFWGSLIGMIPGVFVYVSIGHGLGTLFELGEKPNMSIIFEPEILGPLIGLSVLAALPVVYKAFRKRPPKHGPLA